MNLVVAMLQFSELACLVTFSDLGVTKELTGAIDMVTESDVITRDAYRAFQRAMYRVKTAKIRDGEEYHEMACDLVENLHRQLQLALSIS